MKLYCDVDEEGNIIESLKEYDYPIESKHHYQFLFELELDIDILYWKVLDGQLVLK